MTFKKRMFASLAALSLIMGVIPARAEEDSFEEFLNEKFAEYMEEDYMTLHYTIRDYKALDIEKPEATIGTNTWESYAEAVEAYTEDLNELHTYDLNTLSDDLKVDYRVYETYLENMIALNGFPMEDSAFAPGSGVHDNLLTNFTEFVFYEPEDVEDYLSVLETVPQYLEDCLSITRKQAENGYFLTDGQLDDTQDAIARFTEMKEDNQLIEIFNDNMDKCDFLSEEEKEEYKAKNRTIVLEQYIPAYEKVSEELEKLRGSRSFEGGIANYGQEGKDYYEALVRYKTSSDASIEEQLEMLEDCLSDLILTYLEIYQSNPKIDDQCESETVEVSEPMEILEYLQEHMNEFPEGPSVSYTASYLHPSVANDSILAYYMQPPLDDIKDNVIKINGSNLTETNELFTTLAHEGFPGHLYQITYYLNTNPNHIRAALSNIGYTEGWAMYVQENALKSSTLSEDVATVDGIYEVLGYVEDAAADLGVNGLGWSVEDLADWLDQVGMNSSVAQALYDFVVEKPGMILPYGCGYAQFHALRKNAEEALGKKFDAKEFHEVLLNNGDRPFELVQEDVKAYLLKKSSSTTESGTGVYEPAAPEENQNMAWIVVAVLALAGVCVGVVLGKAKKKDALN